MTRLPGEAYACVQAWVRASSGAGAGAGAGSEKERGGQGQVVSVYNRCQKITGSRMSAERVEGDNVFAACMPTFV